MINVENLGTSCMVGIWGYQEGQENKPRGDLSEMVYGPDEVTWKQSIVTDDVRDQWRIYCPGASAAVFIDTRINDDRLYHTFSVEMIWPKEDSGSHQAGRVLGLDFKFIVKAEIT